jgi:hypothetical protein
MSKKTEKAAAEEQADLDIIDASPEAHARNTRRHYLKCALGYAKKEGWTRKQIEGFVALTLDRFYAAPEED